VLQSISRSMPDVTGPEHREAVGRFRDVLATYREAEDLINIGAYVTGSNPRIDYAQGMIERTSRFLKQPMDERSGLAEAIQELQAMFQVGGEGPHGIAQV
jgi:flagellum-specific ATP synthase